LQGRGNLTSIETRDGNLREIEAVEPGRQSGVAALFAGVPLVGDI